MTKVDYSDERTAVSARECSSIAADAVTEVLRVLDLGERSHYKYNCISTLETIALREIEDYRAKFTSRGKKFTDRVRCLTAGKQVVRDYLRRNSSFLQPNLSSPKVRYPHVVERGSGIARCTSISS